MFSDLFTHAPAFLFEKTVIEKLWHTYACNPSRYLTTSLLACIDFAALAFLTLHALSSRCFHIVLA